MVKRRSDLTEPRQRRRLDLTYDSDAFGQFSESIARYLGTARFLVWQTGVIIIWLALNLIPPARWQFDPWGRGLVLLTLVLSLQASYAAPLILLAQNRQERRDRITAEQDREVAERTQADTEFLAREIASIRLSLADVVTGEELRDELEPRSRRSSGSPPASTRSATMNVAATRPAWDAGELLEAHAERLDAAQQRIGVDVGGAGDHGAASGAPPWPPSR
jgi:uncharacterized membrane protein